jgi:polyisoprenoid-binding protein YceI
MAKTLWQIDPAHTSVEFAVKHMMFTTVRGRFHKLDGYIEADDDNPRQSRVHVDIEAASIDTGAAARDQHLRSADFLDVQNHPTITFESTSVSGAAARAGDTFQVTGLLTIRGSAIEVTLEATYVGQGVDPWGKLRCGFNAKTQIDRRDWGLRWNQALETGGVLVANNVLIETDVQALRQEAPGEKRQPIPAEQVPSAP